MNLKDAYLKHGKGIENLIIKGNGLDGAVISSVTKDKKNSRTIAYTNKGGITDSEFIFYEIRYN